MHFSLKNYLIAAVLTCLVLVNSAIAQASSKQVHLFINHKVGSNTTGHLMQVVIDQFVHHTSADSLLLFFDEWGGLAPAYVKYLGVELPAASRIIEDSTLFQQNIDFQYHTIALKEGDSVLYQGPLKLFNPALLRQKWPPVPTLIPLKDLYVNDLAFFHRLDYLYPDPDGFWLKSDNNMLYKFDYKGKVVFTFDPERDLPWQQLYARVLGRKKDKLQTASYYHSWFAANKRYAFPMYDLHVSTDGHIYVHCAAQPFEKVNSAGGKKTLSAEPYVFLLKINSRTFTLEVLHTQSVFNVEEKVYYDFDHLYLHGNVGYVSTELSGRRTDGIGLSAFSIKNGWVVRPKALKLPAHHHTELMLTHYIKTMLIETNERLFMVRSYDSLVVDVKNPRLSFALKDLDKGSSFNLQNAGRVNATFWYTLHLNTNQSYLLTVMQDTSVVHQFELAPSEKWVLSKAFVHEKVFYVPVQSTDGKLEIKRMAIRF